MGMAIFMIGSTWSELTNWREEIFHEGVLQTFIFVALYLLVGVICLYAGLAWWRGSYRRAAILNLAFVLLLMFAIFFG